jgi:ribosomal protein S19
MPLIDQKKSFLRIKESDVGSTYTVANGKIALNLAITELMVGYRFGQFVLTKKLGSAIHAKKSRKLKRKNG